MANRVTPYVKTVWHNRPSTASPIHETNLNHLEQGVYNVTEAVNNLDIDIPPATRTELGGIKVGNNLTVDQDGTLNANDQSYTLPPATAQTLGGVKVGSNLNVAPDGTISAPDLQKASSSQLGGIKVGRHLTMASDGTLNADDQGGTYTLPPATAQTLGGVKVGENLYINSEGVLSAVTGGGGGSSFSGILPDIEQQFVEKQIVSLTDPSDSGRSFTIGYQNELTAVIYADGSFLINGQTGEDDLTLELRSGTYVGEIQIYTNFLELSDDFVKQTELKEVYFAVSYGNSDITSKYVSMWPNLYITRAEDKGIINEYNKLPWSDKNGSSTGDPDLYIPWIEAPEYIDVTFKANTVYDNVKIFPRFLIPIKNNDQKYYTEILFEEIKTIFNRVPEYTGTPAKVDNAEGTFVLLPSGYFEIEELDYRPGYYEFDLASMFPTEFADIDKEIPSFSFFVAGFSKQIKGVSLHLYDSSNNEIASDNGIFDIERNRINEVDPDFNQITHLYLYIDANHGDVTQLKINPRFIKYVYENSTQELPVATPSRLGAIKVGDNLDIDENGVLSAAAHPVGIATTSRLGIVKIGSRLSIASDGTLSANDQSYTLPTASSSTKGGVQIGDDINVDSSNGKISVDLYRELTPTMIANNAPSGEVIASSYFNNNYPPYYAFTKNTSSGNGWRSADGDGVGSWIGYHFETPVCVNRVVTYNSGVHPPTRYMLQASNDGTTWDDLGEKEITTSSSGTRFILNVPNKKFYTYYRLYTLKTYSTSINYAGFRSINFYRLNDNLGSKPSDDYVKYTKVTPKMTSDTASSGYTVTYSSRYSSSYSGYRCFDENPASGYEWYSAQNDVVGAWVAIQLPSAEVVKRLAIYNRDNSTPYSMKQFKLQGSNDGTNWVDLETCNIPSNTRAIRTVFEINNNNAYTRYRVYVVEGWVSNYVSIAEIEMYRAEVVSGDFASEESIEELFQNVPVLPQANDPIGIKQLAEYDVLIKQYINARIAELS